MRLRWLGHACFELSAPGLPTVLLDPYRPDALGGRFRLPPIDCRPDVVAITHWHEDHAWILPEWGQAVVADRSGSFGGIEITAVPAYHDRALGTRMGLTSSIAFDYDGLRVVHLGDIGDVPPAARLERLGRADVLLVPAGGTWTIGPEQAAQLVRALAPAWAVPMHVRDPRISLDLRPVSDLLACWKGAVRRINGHEIVLSADSRPSEPALLVLG